MIQSQLPRVGIYARQSVEEDQGIAQQIEEMRADLERRGWSAYVVQEFIDNDVSGGADRRGEGTDWSFMLDEIRAGRIDTVVVVAPDRLTRNLEDLLLLRDKARVVTARGGIDTSDSLGMFMLTQFVLIAEQEVRTKNARLVPYKRARHARGVPLPGRVPFGYRWVPELERRARGDLDLRYEIEPKEAEVVRYIFHEAEVMAGGDKGIELGSIARTLSNGKAQGENGEPLDAPMPRSRSDGKKWYTSTVRKILLSPVYAGLLPPLVNREDRPRDGKGRPRALKPQEVEIDACVQGNWESIVSVDQLRVVRKALLDDKLIERRTNGGKTSRKWLLSGLARCGKVLGEGVDSHIKVCGKPVQAAWSRERHRAYRCPVGHFLRRAEVIDEWVVETLLERLSEPDAASLLRPAPTVDLGALTTRERALETRRVDVLSLVSKGRFSLAEAEGALAPLDEELTSVRDALAAAFSVDPLSEIIGKDDVREVWSGLSLAVQRTILGALFEPIVYPVGKGRVVNQNNVAETVYPAWRRVDDVRKYVPGFTNKARRLLATI